MGGAALAAAAALAVFAPNAALAKAQHTGDMMIDEGWVPYNRPAVPSDLGKRPDMFYPRQAFVRQNADLVSGVRPRFNYGRSEMVFVRPYRVPPTGLFDHSAGYDHQDNRR